MNIKRWWYRIGQFWNYYRRAVSIHHVDSPYLSRLLSISLDEKRWYYAFEELELLRNEMKQSDHTIKRIDWGREGKEYETSIDVIAGKSLCSARECRFLFRLIQEFKPNCILELGTSLGLTTLYISRAAASAEIHTVEGDPRLAGLARQHFRWFEGKNIEQHTGPFEKILPELLDKQRATDFSFVDGHHRKAPTVEYMTAILKKSAVKSIHILHDIYHKPGMEEAWQILRKREEVDASIDMFQFGMLIKNPDLFDPIHLSLIPSRWKPWSMGLFR